MTATDVRTDDQADRPRAVLYARSASRVDGWGPVTAQLRSCRQLGAQLELTVARAFVDLGASGLRHDRPGLEQLLAHVKAHRIDYVICANVDRLSRSFQLFNELIRTLHSRGVLIITVEDAVERYPTLAELPDGGQP